MGEFRSYLKDSRSLSVSLVAVLPLLALYELGLILTGSRVEVYAGSLTKRMLGVLGMEAYLALTAAVTLTFFLALLIKARGPARDFRLYGAMILEAMLYGAVLAPAVFWIERGLGVLAAGGNSGELGIRLLLGVGAGVWEELVFRLLLLGGFLWITVRVFSGNRLVFTVLGLLLSSAAFSAFHHLGAYAEPFRAWIFLYRLLAGAVLGGIFLFRGLGICVYTHAFYNVGHLLLAAAAR
jgi:hypothetical protein